MSKLGPSPHSFGAIFSDQAYTLQNLYIVLVLQENLVKADTPDSKDSVAYAWFALDMDNDV